MDVRKDVADFINAPAWEGIVLGPNMTTLTFNLVWALSRGMQPGDEVVVTRLDHGANIDSWKSLQEYGVKIRYIEIKPGDCTLDYDMAKQIISKKTKVVALGIASNAVGTINDVRGIADLAHEVGAHVFLDAVHFAPHYPIDVADMKCDFLVFSGYKCFGPHVGFLWGRQELLDEINPFRPWPSYDKVPYKFNIGTPNMEGFAGARAAFSYIAGIGDDFGASFAPQYSGFSGRRLSLKLGMAAIAEYELGLSRRLNEGLKRFENVQVFGITDPDRLRERCPTYSFTMKGITSAEICRKMSDESIFVWNGEDGLGAQELVEYLDIVKIGGLLRVSIEHYNTAAEIDVFLDVLESISKAI
jgi:cysteine desulfurase family protein (TIGR01976 family)